MPKIPPFLLTRNQAKLVTVMNILLPFAFLLLV
jgi:hypothetical protein